MNSNHIIIMAGGIGSRFWPISTPSYPKQFIDLLDCGRSLLQLTVDRFSGVCPIENFWIVTNAVYVDIVKEQLPEVPLHHILAEPEARNTAPCIAWACWHIRQECPDANIVVTPSDALVLNPEEFRRVIKQSLAFTSVHSSIVTIGIKPTRPEVGYGYVEVQDQEEGEIYRVHAFKEKPDLQTAQSYLLQGNFLWNAGIFVWNIQTIVRALVRFYPSIAEFMDKIMLTGDVQTYFPMCDKISIDYALMEPAAKEGMVFTHPADFGWSDLGNWYSLSDKLSRDTEGNCAVGRVSYYDCSDCITYAKDAKKVVLQGLHGFIVAENKGHILVCKRSEEQRIKEFTSSDECPI